MRSSILMGKKQIRIYKNILQSIFLLLFFIKSTLTLYSQQLANVSITQTPIISATPQTGTESTAQKPPLEQPIQNSVAKLITPIPPGAELIEPKELKDDKRATETPTIYLNFENASLLSVINYLGEQKKINLIPNKDLDATKVTLSTRSPLTLERAWNVLLTLLEMNGFSMIKVGKVYRVVASKDNNFEPLPNYSSGTGTEPEDLPESDLVVRYIYFFKNIKAEMAQGILKSMLDEKGTLINKDLNCCIIKDQCFNIKAAMRILKELDLGGLREQIKIIPLRNTNADTIYNLFKDILQLDKDDKTMRFITPSTQQEHTYFSSGTKIYPDPTKNTLILLGTEKNLDKITDFIYKHLDVPLGNAESRLHLYELRYADAETIKPILEGILKSPSEADKTPIIGEYKFFQDVIISAEKTTGEGGTERGGGNRLIIASSKDDWKRLIKFIEKLDKPQPQIALEILLINTQTTLDKQLGAQNYNFKGKKPGLGIESFETSNLNKGVESVPSVIVDPKDPTKNKADTAQSFIQLAGETFEGGAGHPSYITLGKSGLTGTENIWSIIKATYNLTNQNIIAQPYVVTSNNKPCTVEINNSYLIAGALDSKKGEPSIQKKEKVDAKTSVKITPRINLDGIVDLNVELSVNEFQGEITDTPTRFDRAITTRATLYTGEVLVLGGLTKGTDMEDTYKTPILGDLPIIGTLFKNKVKTHKDTNLYVFIRPSIIKPRFEGGADEYSQLKLDYAKYQMMRNEPFAKDHDPIQRWFFRPSQQTARQALVDRANGVFRPIDDFATGKASPKSVVIKEDPYFKVSEAINEQRKQRNLIKKKKNKRQSVDKAGPTTIKLG
jgi:general secretion pathway protein D